MSFVLPSGMGGGYTWAMSEAPKEDIATAEIEIGRPPKQPNSEPVATVATESLVVTGRAVGTTHARLIQSRSWTPEKTVAEHILTIEVDPDAA